MNRRRILLVVAVLVAALGAGLVFLYAQDAEDRAVDDVALREVLVATQTILPGESVSDAYNAGKIVARNVPADRLCDAVAEGETPPAQQGCESGWTDDGNVFTDQVALTTVYAGELLVTQKFGTLEDVEGGGRSLPIPDGKVAVTLELTETGRVGGFTQPGAHVAILLIDTCGAAALQADPAVDLEDLLEALQAVTIEKDMLVLGVGTTTLTPTTGANGEPLASTAVTLLTLAADQDQAEQLAALDLNSCLTLSFVLRNDESDVKEDRDRELAGSGATGGN